MEVDGLALLVAAAIGIGMPWLAVRSGVPPDMLEGIEDVRTSIYVSAATSLVLLSGGLFLFALWRDIPGSALGWRVDDPLGAFVWAVGITVAGLVLVVAVTRLGRRFGLEESPVSFALMPRTGRETRSFLLMAGIAAVAEEYLFRGYLLAVLAAALGSPAAALVVSSVSFGVSHGYQRTVGIVRTTLLGGLLALPVVWTGSLFPAIVAHFWINAAIGAGGWKRLLPGDAGPGGGSRTDEDR
ncbi:MAG: CPBP family glutamic-type intramembrane protease [Gemmatimonadota bacterium]|nr:CPBP family glutamic-type intramembrane protease [Gemmatimonadota bacterium]